MNYLRDERGHFARRDLFDRLFSRIEITDDGHWLWQGARNNCGYGTVRFESRVVLVHRLVFALLRPGEIEGFELDHLCEIRLCAAPEHLEPVTRRENEARKRREHRALILAQRAISS